MMGFSIVLGFKCTAQPPNSPNKKMIRDPFPFVTSFKMGGSSASG
jgi:hypothetical protein